MPRTTRAARRRTPTRRSRPWRRAAATSVAALVLVLAAGCVGKTGRNDDYVAPGSPEAGPSGQVVPVDD